MSSATQRPEGEPFSELGFPVILLGTATALGGICHVAKLESRLLKILPGEAWMGVGCMAVAGAAYHAMVVAGAGRRKNGVPLPIQHPTAADTGSEEKRIAFLNATRGFGNMFESLGLLALTAAPASNAAPATTGAALVGWSVSRILYTKKYASAGPKARDSGFIGSMVCSSVILGVLAFGLVKAFKK